MDEKQMDWLAYRNSLRNPICCNCGKNLIESQRGEYYQINPPGGYGKPEVAICDHCIIKPEWDYARARIWALTGGKGILDEHLQGNEKEIADKYDINC